MSYNPWGGSMQGGRAAFQQPQMSVSNQNSGFGQQSQNFGGAGQNPMPFGGGFGGSFGGGQQAFGGGFGGGFNPFFGGIGGLGFNPTLGPQFMQPMQFGGYGGFGGGFGGYSYSPLFGGMGGFGGYPQQFGFSPFQGGFGGGFSPFQGGFGGGNPFFGGIGGLGVNSAYREQMPRGAPPPSRLRPEELGGRSIQDWQSEYNSRYSPNRMTMEVPPSFDAYVRRWVDPIQFPTASNKNLNASPYAPVDSYQQPSAPPHMRSALDMINPSVEMAARQGSGFGADPTKPMSESEWNASIERSKARGAQGNWGTYQNYLQEFKTPEQMQQLLQQFRQAPPPLSRVAPQMSTTPTLLDAKDALKAGDKNAAENMMRAIVGLPPL